MPTIHPWTEASLPSIPAQSWRDDPPAPPIAVEPINETQTPLEPMAPPIGRIPPQLPPTQIAPARYPHDARTFAGSDDEKPFPTTNPSRHTFQEPLSLPAAPPKGDSEPPTPPAPSSPSATPPAKGNEVVPAADYAMTLDHELADQALRFGGRGI